VFIQISYFKIPKQPLCVKRNYNNNFDFD